MSYLDINNLYKDRDILLFKECFALEKIHGTSSHITFNISTEVKDNTTYDANWNGRACDVNYFSGGEKHDNFIKLFDSQKLAQAFLALNIDAKTIVYGEAYGGRQQKMSATYGKQLKFIAFEVKIGDMWLNVIDAENICKALELEFVHYERVYTDIETLDKLACAPSVQAKRNGIAEDKLREGIVLRPLIELYKNNGARIIAKHKNEKFKETKQKRLLTDAELKVLSDAEQIADEWCTEMRLSHILGNLQTYDIKDMPIIIKAMIDDISKEAKGEIIDSHEARKAISKRAAWMYKRRLKATLGSTLTG